MHPNRVFSPIRQSQRSMRPPCRPFICSAIHSNPQARLSRSLFSPSSHHLQVPLLEALLPGWCFLSVHGEAKVRLIPTQNTAQAFRGSRCQVTLILVACYFDTAPGLLNLKYGDAAVASRSLTGLCIQEVVNLEIRVYS